MKTEKALRRVTVKAIEMGFNVFHSDSLDPYFKGDLNGRDIVLSFGLSKKERLFCLLHLIGHNIQWNVDENLRELGNKLYTNPDDDKLRQLQEYEWEANCYALQLLHDVGITYLDNWLQYMYQKDMYYLTNFYKTGRKSKKVTEIAIQYSFIKPLIPIQIPFFTVKAFEHSRAGIVV